MVARDCPYNNRPLHLLLHAPIFWLVFPSSHPSLEENLITMAGPETEISLLMANISLSSSESFPFMKLPAELRLMVYDAYFVDLEWWPSNPNQKTSMQSCINLYLVSKQVNDEAKTHWLQYHIPSVHILDSLTGFEEHRQIRQVVPSEYRGRIKGAMKLGGLDVRRFGSAHALRVMFFIRNTKPSSGGYSLEHLWCADVKRHWYDFSGQGWKVECFYRDIRHNQWPGMVFPELLITGDLGRLPFFEQIVAEQMVFR
jgi:hypothetical protein